MTLLNEWLQHLENLALRALDLSEFHLWLFGASFLVLGGLWAALFHRGFAILNRAPYFALSAGVVLAMMLGQFIWARTGLAMLHGWLWILFGLEALFTLIGGYLLVALGQARSRDILGHGRAGILALVPLAVLWLLTTPGQEPSQATPVPVLLRGSLGVVLGLAFAMGTRVLDAEIVPIVEAEILAVAGDPAHSARMVGIRIKQVGLAETLQEFAMYSEAGVRIDEFTTMQRIVANELRLRFHYIISGPDPELGYAAADRMKKEVCDDPVLSQFVAAGANVDLLYLTPANEVIEEIFVLKGDCTI